MSNYREKMREYLKEPNKYSNQYGKWGALNSEQRQLINRLLNEMDSADVVIKKQYEEKQQLISFLEEKIKERMDTIKVNQRDNIEEINNALTRRLAELNIYQEVLNFVNKGGKE